MDLETINWELQRQLLNANTEIDKLAPTVLALEEELAHVRQRRDTLLRAIEEVVDRLRSVMMLE